LKCWEHSANHATAQGKGLEHIFFIATGAYPAGHDLTPCLHYCVDRLLEKFKIFNLYYRLSELRSRDDIIKKIITSMDYSMCVPDIPSNNGGDVFQRFSDFLFQLLQT